MSARSKRWMLVFLLACAFSLPLAGCGRSQTGRQTSPAAEVPGAASARQATKPAAARAGQRLAAVSTVKNPAEAWTRQLAVAQSAFSAGRLEEARSALAELDAIYSGRETPSPQQEQTRQTLELQIAETQRKALDQQRDEKLAAAEAAMNSGRFEQALERAAEVHGAGPTPSQLERAAALRVEVRRRQQLQKEWQPYLDMLASASRRDLEVAQAELRKDPAAALSLLAAISERTDQPALVAGALETLATLERPQQVLPLLVAVLRRDSQRDAWQVAMRQIVQLKHAGAGEELLELALAEAPIEQRLAALETLSQVVDPPPQTLATLLPLVYGDGPLQRLALVASAHAVNVHGQWDAALQSAVDVTPAQRKQLSELPKRLATLSTSSDSPPGDVAIAAQTLAVALRLTAPEPLTGIKVQAASAESADSPAAAALDGIWNSTDAKTMWRHPPEPFGSITLELVQERTIVALKLWNLNEPGGTGRGWKNVKISVGKTESDLASAAVGIVPVAPGAAGTPDYGTIISVPCIRGRFVRLEAESLWQTGGGSGLSEIQVLGF